MNRVLCISVIVLAAMFIACGGSSIDKDPYVQRLKSARGAARLAVQKVVPSASEFSDFGFDWKDDNNVRVTGLFVGKNAFNAVVQNEFSVRVEFLDGGKVRTFDIKISP